MDYKKWAAWFFKIAEVSASASKDPSGRVGAVIADGKNVVSLGYNGFAKKVHDTEERLNNRDLKYSLTIHAELNAILNAKRDLKGLTLYCTHPPCVPCASVIIQSDITKIVHYKPTEDFLSRWGGR